MKKDNKLRGVYVALVKELVKEECRDQKKEEKKREEMLQKKEEDEQNKRKEEATEILAELLDKSQGDEKVVDVIQEVATSLVSSNTLEDVNKVIEDATTDLKDAVGDFLNDQADAVNETIDELEKLEEAEVDLPTEVEKELATEALADLKLALDSRANHGTILKWPNCSRRIRWKMTCTGSSLGQLLLVLLELLLNLLTTTRTSSQPRTRKPLTMLFEISQTQKTHKGKQLYQYR